jgi:hypothetical protein
VNTLEPPLTGEEAQLGVGSRGHTWTVEEDVRREEVDVDEGTTGRTL